MEGTSEQIMNSTSSLRPNRLRTTEGVRLNWGISVASPRGLPGAGLYPTLVEGGPSSGEQAIYQPGARPYLSGGQHVTGRVPGIVPGGAI